MTTETDTPAANQAASQSVECPVQKAVQAFNELLPIVRAMNPRGRDGYANLEIQSFGYPESMLGGIRVHFGREVSEGAIKFSSIDDLRAQLAAYDPEEKKRKEIAELEARLAELKGRK